MQPNVDGQYIHGQFKHVHGQYKLCSILKFLDDIQFLVFVEFCSDVDIDNPFFSNNQFCSNVKFTASVKSCSNVNQVIYAGRGRRAPPPPRLALGPQGWGSLPSLSSVAAALGPRSL